jgi:hypothetical protein
VRYGDALLGDWWPTFRDSMVVSTSHRSKCQIIWHFDTWTEMSDTCHPVWRLDIPEKRRPQPTAAKISHLQSLVATAPKNKVDVCTGITLFYLKTLGHISTSSSVLSIIIISYILHVIRHVYSIASFSKLQLLINLLKPSGNFTYHQVQHQEILCGAHIAFMCFVRISE